MNQELLTDIQNILNPISDKILYFYEGGSRASTLIDNCNDHDIICVCKSEKDRATCRRWLLDNGWVELKKDKDLDFNFTTEQYQELGIYESWYPYIVKERICYTLDGTCSTKTISIEEFLNKKEVIKNWYLNRINDIKERAEKINSNGLLEKYYIKKIWYCIYITNCIFKNNSWDLTEEQKETVNLLHDWHNLTVEIAKPIVDQLVEDINNL